MVMNPFSLMSETKLLAMPPTPPLVVLPLTVLLTGDGVPSVRLRRPPALVVVVPMMLLLRIVVVPTDHRPVRLQQLALHADRGPVGPALQPTLHRLPSPWQNVEYRAMLLARARIEAARERTLVLTPG
jgi:hypothetical protein